MEDLIIQAKNNCVNKSEEIFHKLSHNLIIIDEYLKAYLCNNDTIYIAFNGGKDSIAAYLALKFYLFIKENNKSLHSYSTFLEFIRNYNNVNITKVKLLYFLQNDCFTEEDDYFLSILNSEKVKSLICYSDFKNGLLYTTKHDDVKFIFMGVRHDDITSNANETIDDKKLIHKSDSGYSDFIRLYPIYDFNYYEVWGFILLLNFPYPCLYDQGYSSVGKKSKTFKNINLCYKESTDDDNSKTVYLPAYCLSNSETERNYR